MIVGWIILILMVSPDANKHDAVEISHRMGKPLVFETKEDCENHVMNNSFYLTAFALSQFDSRIAVDKIACIKKVLKGSTL